MPDGAIGQVALWMRSLTHQTNIVETAAANDADTAIVEQYPPSVAVIPDVGHGCPVPGGLGIWKFGGINGRPRQAQTVIDQALKFFHRGQAPVFVATQLEVYDICHILAGITINGVITVVGVGRDGRGLTLPSQTGNIIFDAIGDGFDTNCAIARLGCDDIEPNHAILFVIQSLGGCA